MHEMSLAEGIRGIVEDAAIAQGFTKVNAVVLEVGALSSVEIEALRFCFEVVMKGTVAEGARMEVDPIAGTGWCMPCNVSTTGLTYCSIIARKAASLASGRAARCLAKSLMSPPAMKWSPAPSMIRTSKPPCSRKAAMAFARSSIISTDSAFKASGRLSVRVAIRSATEWRTVLAMAGLRKVGSSPTIAPQRAPLGRIRRARVAVGQSRP